MQNPHPEKSQNNQMTQTPDQGNDLEVSSLKSKLTLDQDINSSTDNLSEAVSMAGTLLATIIFSIMILMLTNSIFHSKLDNILEDQAQLWSTLHITNDSPLEFEISYTKQGASILYIRKDQAKLISAPCHRFSTFCKGLKEKEFTPSAIDILVRHKQQDDINNYNATKLKTIYYLDQNLKPQHLSRDITLPNSAKAREQSKKSFLNFFVITFIVFVAMNLFFYLLLQNNNPELKPKLIRFSQILMLFCTLNYIYFIFKFFTSL